MDINGIIGQNIKTLRQKKDWNYSQLCRELGKINKKMQTTQLRMIENGERKIACEDVLMFASVLNVSPNALMTPNTFSDNESSITDELTYIEQLPQMTEEEISAWLTGELKGVDLESRLAWTEIKYEENMQDLKESEERFSESETPEKELENLADLSYYRDREFIWGYRIRELKGRK